MRVRRVRIKTRIVTHLDELGHKFPAPRNIRSRRKYTNKKTHLWNSVRRRSFTKFPWPFLGAIAWFLKIRSVLEKY